MYEIRAIKAEENVRNKEKEKERKRKSKKEAASERVK